MSYKWKMNEEIKHWWWIGPMLAVAIAFAIAVLSFTSLIWLWMYLK